MKVARNLGKTLRAFQPTIREIQVGSTSYFPFWSYLWKDDIKTAALLIHFQDVSREFKSTLEREIGLDDMQNTYNPYRNNYSTPPVANPNDSTDVADPSESIFLLLLSINQHLLVLFAILLIRDCLVGKNISRWFSA